jgi:hypothetical protein
LGNYINENLNPAGHQTTDCVIRTLAKVTGKSWEEVYIDLVAIGLEKKRMPNNDVVWKAYAVSQGFVYRKLPPVKKGQKRPKVAGAAKELGEGVRILKVTKHLVAAIDGNYHDSWDCGGYAVYGYWEQEKK